MDDLAVRQIDSGPAQSEPTVSAEALREALLQEAAAIESASEQLNAGHLEAVELIFNCQGRVITCGIGKSGHVARKTAGTLSSTGTPSLFLHAAEAVHGDLGMITKDDVVLMYSHSGETDELVRLFPAIKAIGAKTMLMTGRKESSAGRLADLVIETFVGEEACPNNLAPTTSTTVMMALSDAISIAVMKLRRFGPEDFARFHPSGTLGKRLLLTIRDVMRRDADVALVNRDTQAIEIMQAITRAGAGAAIVVEGDDALVGLITDGDLRRHFIERVEPLGFRAGELMTANPSTLGPELLAVDALEYFQNLERKVGEIPIVENGKVLGLLVLKDLLRSGII